MLRMANAVSFSNGMRISENTKARNNNTINISLAQIKRRVPENTKAMEKKIKRGKKNADCKSMMLSLPLIC